jgi:hypothetical protein
MTQPPGDAGGVAGASPARSGHPAERVWSGLPALGATSGQPCGGKVTAAITGREHDEGLPGDTGALKSPPNAEYECFLGGRCTLRLSAEYPLRRAGSLQP